MFKEQVVLPPAYQTRGSWPHNLRAMTEKAVCGVSICLCSNSILHQLQL